MRTVTVLVGSGPKELAGWETEKMVRRYAHLAAEHLAVYAGNTESHGTITAQAPDFHGRIWCIAGLELGKQDPGRRPHARALSHCFFSDQRLHQPGPNLNWHLRIRCTSSKPARVRAAVL